MVIRRTSLTLMSQLINMFTVFKIAKREAKIRFIGENLGRIVSAINTRMILWMLRRHCSLGKTGKISPSLTVNEMTGTWTLFA